MNFGFAFLKLYIYFDKFKLACSYTCIYSSNTC